jgi:hypothetical protein
MKLYRVTQVSDGGTRTKILQRQAAVHILKRAQFLYLYINYRSWPVTETRIEVADIPDELWKEWTPDGDRLR